MTDLSTDSAGDTQVVDLGDVDLRDVDLSEPAPRGTAPPPLPALPAAAPPGATPAVAGMPAPPSRQRSTGFYIGVLVACLALSLAVGFVIASGLRRGEPKAAPAPSATPRVITISPVEVN